jgi:hypothetical protein
MRVLIRRVQAAAITRWWAVEGEPCVGTCTLTTGLTRAVPASQGLGGVGPVWQEGGARA